MDSLTLRFVFDRKGITLKEPKKESLKKEALIQIEVYDKLSRKKKYISTGEYILRKQYSDVGPPRRTLYRATSECSSNKS